MSKTHVARGTSTWVAATAIVLTLIAAGCGGSSFLHPVLKIKGVDPPLGPSAGGPTIRLVGAGFVSGGTEVMFGDIVVPSGDIEFVSQVELRVFLPPLPTATGIGPTDITVTNPADEMGSGGATAVLRQAFSYYASSIDFESYRNFITPAGPRFAAATDLDRNGVDDLVIAHRGDLDGISRFRSLGNGSFEEQVPFLRLRGIIPDTRTISTVSVEPNRLVLAPFLGGLFDDLMVTAQTAHPRGGPETPELFVLANTGFGDFRFSQSFRFADVPTTRARILADIPPLEGAGGIASGDFDADGIDDAAVAYLNSASVGVLFGNGFGGFDRTIELHTGLRPVDLVASDLNGDSRVDLAIANFGDGTVSIYFGLGDGRFIPAATAPLPNGSFPCGSFPIAIALGSFSASDSIPDLVVANNRSNGVSILEGDGFGGFGEPRQFRAGSGPSAITVADIDGAGGDDLAVCNADSSTITLLFQMDPGQFTEETLATGKRPEAVIAGSFVANEVTAPDLITINAGADTFSLHQNVGLGFFDQPEFIGATPPDGAPERRVAFENPFASIVEDFDRDGLDDLVVFDNGREEAIFLIGTQDGQFVELEPVLTPLSTGILHAAAADVNGDGSNDIVIARSDALGLDVRAGDGQGGFDEVLMTIPSLGSSDVTSLELVDIEGNELVDLITTSNDAPIVRVYEFATPNVPPRLRSTSLLTGVPTQLQTGDWNEDSITDLAVAVTSAAGPALDILLGNRQGKFTLAMTFDLENETASLTVGDLNGDKHVDLVVLEQASSAIRFFTGDGNGRFTAAEIEQETPTPIAILTCADVNADRIADLIGLDTAGNQLLVWRSQGADGKFDSPVIRGVAENPTAVLTFRPDGLTIPDLIVLHRSPALLSLIRNVSS